MSGPRFRHQRLRLRSSQWWPREREIVLIASKVVSMESVRRLIFWVDFSYIISMIKKIILFPIPYCRPEVRGSRKRGPVVHRRQVSGPDKALLPLLHAHDLSLDLTLLPGRYGEPAGSPKNGTTAPRDRPARRLYPRHRRRPRPRSMPMQIRLVDRAASAPSLGGEVRQRPERLPGAPDPAAAPAHTAEAPAVRHPVRARQHAAVARPGVSQAPSPRPGVGSPARLRRRVRLGCAKRVRAHWGLCGQAPSGRFRLHRLAASSPEGQR